MANDSNRLSQTPSDMVIVGCKLATGIWLELINIPENTSPSAQNWNPKPTGPRVKLAGANSAAETAAVGGSIIRVNPRVFTYGRTLVKRDFWEAWLARNRDMDFVKKGFIFAETKDADFRAHAREGLSEKTGLEGLSPEGNDERMRKIQVPGMPETKIETDKEHLERLQRSMEAA